MKQITKKSKWHWILMSFGLVLISISDSNSERLFPMDENDVLYMSTDSSGAKEKKEKAVNYSKHPHWVQMMDDPNVNYHQAKKAFEEFWKDRGEPEEEEKHEHEKEKKERSVFKRLLKSDERLEEENRELSIPYRRFKKWLIDMEPYVQPDGSILSMDEQMKIWENARK